MMDVDAVVTRSGVDDGIAEMNEWILSMGAECDKGMSDVTEQDVASVSGNGEDGGSDVSDGRSRFAALDREILAILTANGASTSSSKNASWSRRRFDEWRLQNGMPTSIPIETMEIKDLAALLPTFFRQVVKHSGDRYPLESLLGFYQGVNRIMQKAQEARMCETRVTEMPFCMKAFPIFRETEVAFLESMRRSVLAGANKGRKSAPVTSWADEQAMLAASDHQPSHPYGCFRRWAYYCISRFAIRSGKELYNVMDYDFEERIDKDGSSIIYGERLLKNAAEMPSATTGVNVSPLKAWKKAKVEPVRVAVHCLEKDVIHTYRQFMKHQPVKVEDEVGKPRHLFLQPIGNPVTNAWFAKAHVSERVLISMFKTMAVIAGINSKDIGSRVGRPVNASIVTGDGSPMTSFKGSAMTGISNNGLFNRYDTDVDAAVDVLQSSEDKVLDPKISKRSFEDAFREADDTQQNSSGASSEKSPFLLENSPNVSSDAGLQTPVLAADGNALNSDQQPAAKVDSKSQDQDVFTKLHIVRSQFKDLEVTLFEKIVHPFSHPGQSLQDLLQMALSQLKGLENTVSSMISSVT